MFYFLDSLNSNSERSWDILGHICSFSICVLLFVLLSILSVCVAVHPSICVAVHSSLCVAVHPSVCVAVHQIKFGHILLGMNLGIKLHLGMLYIFRFITYPLPYTHQTHLIHKYLNGKERCWCTFLIWYADTKSLSLHMVRNHSTILVLHFYTTTKI